MKKANVLALEQAIKSCANLVGPKFVYAVARNFEVVSKEAESIRAAIKPAPDFTVYEQDRIELGKKLAKKDESGKPQTTPDGSQFIITDMVVFEKEIEKLKIKHKKALDIRDQQLKDFEALLDTESDIKLFKVNHSEMPANITAGQEMGIVAMIDFGEGIVEKAEKVIKK